MSDSDQAARVARNMQRQDYERQMAQASGGSEVGNSAGPPDWNRGAWEAFKAQNGFYPFGWQNGGVVYPPTFAGAPDWVYELMNLRKPPMSVESGSSRWDPETGLL